MTDTERLDFLSLKKVVIYPNGMSIYHSNDWIDFDGVPLRTAIDLAAKNLRFEPDNPDLPVHDQIPGSEP